MAIYLLPLFLYGHSYLQKQGVFSEHINKFRGLKITACHIDIIHIREIIHRKILFKVSFFSSICPLCPLSAYILNVHISDHQPVILYTDDDLPHKKLKYITIKTNSEEAKKHFCSSFKSKNIMDLLDKNIYAIDPNENYEVLERTLKEVHTECFPERIVRFNDKKHKKTPWITTGILNSINRRNKLYRVLKQTKTDAISYATKKIILTDIEMF